MGCGASTSNKKITLEKCEQQTDDKIEDEDILALLRDRSLQPVIGVGRTKEALKAALNLLDLKDDQVSGKWPQLAWQDLQESAVSSILKPSTIHQGDTTTCGAISVLEAMVYYRPSTYAQLVLAIYTAGQVRTHDGLPWGDTPDVRPELLAAAPPDSITGRSVADWMAASAMIAELKDQTWLRDMMGHDEYLGGDATGPDGKTVDHARGLMFAWDVRKMMKELLGCSEVERDRAYWMPFPSITDKMIALTASGALDRGETVLICLISNTLWKQAELSPNVEGADGWAVPEHWVRVRSVVDNGYGDMLTVSVFSFGEVQSWAISKAGWQRIYFEALFGKLNV